MDQEDTTNDFPRRKLIVELFANQIDTIERIEVRNNLGFQNRRRFKSYNQGGHYNGGYQSGQAGYQVGNQGGNQGSNQGGYNQYYKSPRRQYKNNHFESMHNFGFLSNDSSAGVTSGMSSTSTGMSSASTGTSIFSPVNPSSPSILPERFTIPEFSTETFDPFKPVAFSSNSQGNIWGSSNDATVWG